MYWFIITIRMCLWHHASLKYFILADKINILLKFQMSTAYLLIIQFLYENNCVLQVRHQNMFLEEIYNVTSSRARM